MSTTRELREAIEQAELAAAGDSNDAEIAALWDALRVAQSLIAQMLDDRLLLVLQRTRVRLWELWAESQTDAQERALLVRATAAERHHEALIGQRKTQHGTRWVVIVEQPGGMRWVTAPATGLGFSLEEAQRVAEQSSWRCTGSARTSLAEIRP